jgi:hypothetical protein
MGGPGSGRKPSGNTLAQSNKIIKESVKKGNTFSLNLAKMKANPIPKALKKKFMKSGGINSPAYKAWVKKNWT